jgi:membrane protein implicated in regulation of membrane protease activity
MHYSWLLDGKEMQATTVLSTILDLLRQRSIGGLTIAPERLTERGITLEERDYLKVRRGVSSVFIYVAPAGRDLYISRATTVLPAINIMRVIGLLLLLALAFFGPGILQNMAGPAGYFLGGLFFLFVIPIWLYFLWLLFRSFSYWLVEKDFWVYLRANQLNDFQLDDIALLEHVTDETVRVAVEQLGLDASKILPPTQGYQPKQRIRII